MTDRILSDFHSWVKEHQPTDIAPDLTMHMGRHARPVIRHMWAAWQAHALNCSLAARVTAGRCGVMRYN